MIEDIKCNTELYKLERRILIKLYTLIMRNTFLNVLIGSYAHNFAIFADVNFFKFFLLNVKLEFT